MKPLVSIIIVHYGDPNFLGQCLESVKRSDYSQAEVIVVDNNEDGSSPFAVDGEGPATLKYTYIKNTRNAGYGGGCNDGIRASVGKYVFLLNNDIEIHPHCISALVEFAEEHREIGVLQPKMLDYYARRTFHSGGGGGFIDLLGYPFARGRIFGAVEEDRGQYDDVVEVFWAGGAALFASRDAVERAGLFDPDFFLYMEEIDLAWRVRLLGYRVVYLPHAAVYHIGCPHLGRRNFLRMYFDHRNSVVMLIKNLSLKNLFLFLPARLGLEAATVIGSMACLRFTRAFAILRALAYVLAHLRTINGKRRLVQRMRKVRDEAVLAKAYHGSVALSYFLWRIRAAADLKGFHVDGYVPEKGKMT